MRGLEKWTARATSSLPTPLSPRISTVARLGAARAISLLHLLHHGAGADDLALHAQPLAQLHVFVANLIQVLGQLLLPAQIFERHGHRVGHGQREFQIVRDRARARRRSNTGESRPARLPSRRIGAQITLVAWISPLLSRLPSWLSSITLRASTASPSRSTVEARNCETR